VRLGRLEDAGAEHFVVAKGFELGLEDVDHGHRMAESIEDFQIVTVFRPVSLVIFHRCRHVAATQTGTRQINGQRNSTVERKFHVCFDKRPILVSEELMSFATLTIRGFRSRGFEAAKGGVAWGGRKPET